MYKGENWLIWGALGHSGQIWNLPAPVLQRLRSEQLILLLLVSAGPPRSEWPTGSL